MDGAPRCRQVVVRFSPSEFAEIQRRADGAGLAVGAWIGQVAVHAAAGEGLSAIGGLRGLLRELIATRADLVDCVPDAVVVDAVIDALVVRLS